MCSSAGCIIGSLPPGLCGATLGDNSATAELAWAVSGSTKAKSMLPPLTLWHFLPTSSLCSQAPPAALQKQTKSQKRKEERAKKEASPAALLSHFLFPCIHLLSIKEHASHARCWQPRRGPARLCQCAVPQHSYVMQLNRHTSLYISSNTVQYSYI